MNHKAFCMKSNIKYKEIVVNNPMVHKFYEIHNPYNQDFISIPDGCVDIEFVSKGEEAGAFVCGSLLDGKKSGLATYDRCFGIRFNPGTIPDCFKDRIQNITNNRCELKNFMNMEGMQVAFSERISLEDKADYFMDKFFEHNSIETHIITDFILQKVKEGSGLVNITELIHSTGYSHCYVDRIFKYHVGVSVKKYSNIIRLQEAIDFVKNHKEDKVYECLGFYDQSHFIHEFKRCTSITPSVFIQMKEFCIV